jgi:DNA-directed RNA polymerase subunit beta
VTTLLYALGWTTRKSSDLLQQGDVPAKRGRLARFRSTPSAWRGVEAEFDMVDAKTGEVVFPAGRRSPRARPTRRERTA